MVSICSRPALRCVNEKCKCNINHKACILDIRLDKLLLKMDCEGKKYLMVLKVVKESYENMLKRITIELEEFNKIIDEASLSLYG